MTDDPRRAVEQAAVDAAWERERAAVSQTDTSVPLPDDGTDMDPAVVSERLSADLGMEVDLQYDDPEYLAMMETEIRRLDQHGLLEGLNVITDVPDRFEHDLKDQASGLYNTQTQELYVAPEEVIGEEPRERQAREGYFSTDKNFGSVWHELGHHWIRQANPDADFEAGPHEDYWGEREIVRAGGELLVEEGEFTDLDWYSFESIDPGTKKKFLDAADDRIESEVSEYATHGGMEFVAETFAGLVAGEEYPEWVMDLYDDLGGYEPPQNARDPAAAYVPMVAPSAAGAVGQVAGAAASGAVEAAVHEQVVVDRRAERFADALTIVAEEWVDAEWMLETWTDTLRNRVVLGARLFPDEPDINPTDIHFSESDGKMVEAILRYPDVPGGPVALDSDEHEERTQRIRDAVRETTPPDGLEVDYEATWAAGHTGETPHVTVMEDEKVAPREFAEWFADVREALREEFDMDSGEFDRPGTAHLDWGDPEDQRTALKKLEIYYGGNALQSAVKTVLGAVAEDHFGMSGDQAFTEITDGEFVLDDTGALVDWLGQFESRLAENFLLLVKARLEQEYPDADTSQARTVSQSLPAANFGQENAVLYRGASLDAMNKDEFIDNTIDGGVYDVWYADMSAEERDATREGSSVSKYRTKDVRDTLSEYIVDHEEVEITGGLTDAIGTAINFQSPGPTDIGVMLYLDADKIPGALESIEYDADYLDDHPGTLAHVDSLTVGEVFVNDKLWGTVGYNKQQDTHPINEWGDQARDKITFNRFTAEREVVARTNDIDLDGATVAVASHYHTKQAIGGALRATLNDLPGYSHSGFGDQTFTEAMDDREVTEALWQETVDMLQWPAEDYWIVVREDDRLDRDSDQIPRDEFKWAYNGDRGFVEDYDAVGLLVGKDRTLDVASATEAAAGDFGEWPWSRDKAGLKSCEEEMDGEVDNQYAFCRAWANESGVEYQVSPQAGDSITCVTDGDDEIHPALRAAAKDGEFDGGAVSVGTMPPADLGPWAGPGVPIAENPLMIGQGCTVRMPVEDFRELQTYIGTTLASERFGADITREEFWQTHPERVESIAAVLRGDEPPEEIYGGIPMPYVEIGSDGTLRGVQEGRHRTVAAQQVGLDTIPVRILYNEDRVGEGAPATVDTMTAMGSDGEYTMIHEEIDSAIQASIGQEINDREFGLIVPKTDNSGKKIKPEIIEDIAHVITQRFGGVTVYPEIAGCFIPEEGEMAGELMCEENVLITTIRDSDDGVPFEEDAEFLRNIGEEVGRDLGQISVLVTEDRTEVEFVSGQFREELPDHMVDPESVFQSLL